MNAKQVPFLVSQSVNNYVTLLVDDMNFVILIVWTVTLWWNGMLHSFEIIDDRLIDML